MDPSINVVTSGQCQKLYFITQRFVFIACPFQYLRSYLSPFFYSLFEVPGLSNYATAVVQRKRLNEISILDFLSSCGNFILTSASSKLGSGNSAHSTFHFQIIAKLMWLLLNLSKNFHHCVIRKVASALFHFQHFLLLPRFVSLCNLSPPPFCSPKVSEFLCEIMSL